MGEMGHGVFCGSVGLLGSLVGLNKGLIPIHLPIGELWEEIIIIINTLHQFAPEIMKLRSTQLLVSGFALRRSGLGLGCSI